MMWCAKRKRILLSMSIALTLLMTILVCWICITNYLDRHSEPGTLIVNGETIKEPTAYFTRNKVWLPMIPIMEAYGYTFTYESDDFAIVTKEDCVYHLDLTDLTLILVECPAYENDEMNPYMNILVPPVGAKYKDHPIVRKGDDIWVDNVTMQGILVNLHEKSQYIVNYKDRNIEFRRWDE